MHFFAVSSSMCAALKGMMQHLTGSGDHLAPRPTVVLLINQTSCSISICMPNYMIGIVLHDIATELDWSFLSYMLTKGLRTGTGELMQFFST